MTIPTPYENYLNDVERNIDDYGPHVNEVMNTIKDGTEADIIESELRKNVDYYRLTITEAKRRVVRLHGGNAEAIVSDITYIADVEDNDDNEYNIVGKVLDVTKKIKGTNKDGTPKKTTEVTVEDQTGKITVVIWMEIELTVNNEYAFKKCRFDKKFKNLNLSFPKYIVDRGVAQEYQNPIVRKIENIINISDSESGNGKWIKGTVVSVSEDVNTYGNPYKRVSIRDETGTRTFFDWGNRDYTEGETITAKIEVNHKNDRVFLSLSKNCKIIRG